MARKNNPQTIYVKLSCGHIEGILTSLYRVHKSTRSCIIGAAVRKGVWCNACGGTEQVVGNADKPRPTGQGKGDK